MQGKVWAQNLDEPSMRPREDHWQQRTNPPPLQTTRIGRRPHHLRLAKSAHSSPSNLDQPRRVRVAYGDR